MPERSVGQAVREILAGKDVAANWEFLYRQNRHGVHRWFSRNGMPDHACQDLTQDAFRVAVTRLSSLRDPERFTGWLFGIAAKLAHQSRNRRAVVVSIAAGEAGKGVIAEESLPGKEPDPLDRMLSAELIERIAALLQEMPEKTRACLKLRLIDGYSPGEIARRLGITEQSVRTQVCRGKQKLREGLRDQIGKVDMLADDPDEGSEP